MKQKQIDKVIKKMFDDYSATYDNEANEWTFRESEIKMALKDIESIE